MIYYKQALRWLTEFALQREGEGGGRWRWWWWWGGGGRQYSTACATLELYFCHTEIDKNDDVKLILLWNAQLDSTSLGKKRMCIRAREYVLVG